MEGRPVIGTDTPARNLLHSGYQISPLSFRICRGGAALTDLDESVRTLKLATMRVDSDQSKIAFAKRRHLAVIDTRDIRRNTPVRNMSTRSVS